MSTTKKQTKTRKSRESDRLSNIENLDIMLGGKRNNLERESESSNFGRRPDSLFYDTSIIQNTNSHSNSQVAEIRTYAQNSHSLRETDSSSEFNRLSGELIQRITQEMGDHMSTLCSQTQRAINEAISDEIWPPIEATLWFGDKDRCPREDGRFRLEDSTDLKKPQIADSEATREMSFLGSQTEMNTYRAPTTTGGSCNAFNCV